MKYALVIIILAVVVLILRMVHRVSHSQTNNSPEIAVFAGIGLAILSLILIPLIGSWAAIVFVLIGIAAFLSCVIP